MQYKTIVLELLQQRPTMYERLRQERMVLATMELYALELKASHKAWKEHLMEVAPGSHPIQIASEALEQALAELEERLPSESPPSDSEPEALSLDAAMAHLRRLTPRG